MLTTITKLDRLAVSDLMSELNTVAQKHGVRLSLAGGKLLSDAESLLNVRVQVKDTKMVSDAQRRDFNRWCKAFGMEPEDFRGTFMFRGQAYRIVGFNPNAPKYCIAAERCYDGKQFRFPRASASFITRVKAAA